MEEGENLMFWSISRAFPLLPVSLILNLCINTSAFLSYTPLVSTTNRMLNRMSFSPTLFFKKTSKIYFQRFWLIFHRISELSSQYRYRISKIQVSSVHCMFYQGTFRVLVDTRDAKKALYQRLSVCLPVTLEDVFLCASYGEMDAPIKVKLFSVLYKHEKLQTTSTCITHFGSVKMRFYTYFLTCLQLWVDA